jgi:hypothetical protein
MTALRKARPPQTPARGEAGLEVRQQVGSVNTGRDDHQAGGEIAQTPQSELDRKPEAWVASLPACVPALDSLTTEGSPTRC